jgi:hypothetical protein
LLVRSANSSNDHILSGTLWGNVQPNDAAWAHQAAGSRQGGHRASLAMEAASQDAIAKPSILADLKLYVVAARNNGALPMT